MSSTPREVGTLIVVVLKANHLPNKRHIGKQDPYCLVVVNGEKRRTKAIKRGGQHPEWDEEIRFTLYEDVEDVLARTAKGDGTPPPPPPKDAMVQKKIKGGKTMKLACYADDPREPDLIGETIVDLTEVLTKGETDEWFTLTNKDKFAGKVYLELTFWSNEPVPEKKLTPKPTKANKQYGGPGSFVPSGEPSPAHSSRVASTSGAYAHSRQTSETLPSSLRPSGSAHLDLYVAPYEQRSKILPVDILARDFEEFGVAEPHRRRDSLPPVPTGYGHRPQSTASTLTSYHSYGHEPSISDASSLYLYDRPLTPPGQSSHVQNSLPGPMQTYSPHNSYQPPYDPVPQPAYQTPTRGPRHSMPTSSSGFVPLQSSGFVPLQPPLSENSSFAPSVSYTPSPSGYNAAQFLPTYAPPPPQTPMPTNYLPPSSSGTFLQQPFTTSQSFGYSQFTIPQSTSAPPQQYLPATQSPVSLTLQTNPAPPQTYQNYPTTPSISHDNLLPHPPAPPMNFQPGNSNGSSRPLPQQPQLVYTQPPVQVATPPSGNSPQHLSSYSPTQTGNVFPNNTYSTIPPPPPLQYSTEPQLYTSSQAVVPPPPPPPPLINTQPRRHASLPHPPVLYQQPQPPVFQPPPPPPPPPLTESYTHAQPPPPPLPTHDSKQNFTLGPPPKPPAPVVDNHWSPQQSQQNGYTAQAY